MAGVETRDIKAAARQLADVLRFNRQSLELLQGESYDLELAEYAE